MLLGNSGLGQLLRELFLLLLQITYPLLNDVDHVGVDLKESTLYFVEAVVDCSQLPAECFSRAGFNRSVGVGEYRGPLLFNRNWVEKPFFECSHNVLD